MPFFNAVTQQQLWISIPYEFIFLTALFFLSCFRSPLLSDLITEEIMAFVDINTNLNNIPNENKKGKYLFSRLRPFFLSLRDCCRIRKMYARNSYKKVYRRDIYTSDRSLFAVTLGFKFSMGAYNPAPVDL